MTLTELLVVVAIIAALVILGMAYFRSQIFKSNDARRKAETRRIGIAAEEYQNDHGCFPLPSLIICEPGSGLQPYLDKIPCDPISGASYFYEHEDSSCPTWYRLYTILEHEADPDYINGVGPGNAFNFVYESSNAPNINLSGGATPPPSGGGSPPSGYYGCFSGACSPISWDPDRPGPECDPNYQNSSCYAECVNPSNDCMPWN